MSIDIPYLSTCGVCGICILIYVSAENLNNLTFNFIRARQ